MTTPLLVAGSTERKPVSPAAKRVLWVSCAAHALHDGYTDLIYVLLPVWQAEFGLSYGALATLRAVYGATMACLQLSAGGVARRIGRRATLALGTLLAAVGYAAAGLSGSLLGLCVALAVSGCGSSTQHPLASTAVSDAYGRRARGPLGIYNFAGDLGKAALPAALSLLVVQMPWRHALWVIAAAGMLVAAGIALFLPSLPRTAPAAQRQARSGAHASTGGFRLLLAIGVLDTAVRMGMLTFLPFLLQAKGISTPMLGTALALVFIGGAAGKFLCGWLGERLGVTGTVLVTEGGTAACIVAVLLCPLGTAMVLLPLLGLMLNGTSSVLYGSVPDMAPPDGTERAFAVFYTGTIASGAIAPIVYGFLGDHVGTQMATLTTALTALAIVPLAFALRPRLTGVERNAAAPTFISSQPEGLPMNTVSQTPLILITGGSRGVGAATARLAAAQGYDVAISYVSNEPAARAVCSDVEALGRRALAVRADSADPVQVAQLFAAIDGAFGRIDVLVNNAAIIARQSRLEGIDFARLQRMFAVNAIGPILCAQHAVKRMSQHSGGRGGAIVNVSSASARLGSPNEYVDYASSKGALETFTLGLAKEVAREGIRVNCIRPGHIYTEMHASGGEPNRVDRVKDSIPMGRGGQPEEVARAILWLAGGEASFVTGTFLDVTGGK